jgi:hypothetical protein
MYCCPHCILCCSCTRVLAFGCKYETYSLEFKQELGSSEFDFLLTEWTLHRKRINRTQIRLVRALGNLETWMCKKPEWTRPKQVLHTQWRCVSGCPDPKGCHALIARASSDQGTSIPEKHTSTGLPTSLFPRGRHTSKVSS